MDTNIAPTVGVGQKDLAQAVRESAILSDVTISTWSAERTDKNLMEQVKSEHNAVGNVGRLVKNILAGADGKLKDVRAAYDTIRVLHAKMTLPWCADPHALRQTGPRLLPLALFDEYLGKLSEQKRKAVALLEEFLQEYPALVEKARENLGTMADAVYPTADEVRASFKAMVDYNPIPMGRDFQGLPPATLERLSRSLQNKQKHMLATAQADMWGRVRERVERLTERLSDPEAKFHASTVENLRELIGLLPGFNVTDDPRVPEIVEDIKRMLDGVDAEKLRGMAGIREDVAAKGKAVADKLSAWGV